MKCHESIDNIYASFLQAAQRHCLIIRVFGFARVNFLMYIMQNNLKILSIDQIWSYLNMVGWKPMLLQKTKVTSPPFFILLWNARDNVSLNECKLIRFIGIIIMDSLKKIL